MVGTGRVACAARGPRPVVAGFVIAVVVLLAAVGCASPGAADRATVIVAAASSLTSVFGELEERFERQNPGVDVVVDAGGSAALAQRIVLGGGADVFAAASDETMATVVDAGLARDPRLFARNRLALAVPSGNAAGVTGLADLARPELTIALCDPAVPCGSAAADLLAQRSLTPRPDTLEQDVKSVLAKLVIGEADAGLVYATDVRTAVDAVEEVPVPGVEAVDIRYPIAALTDARDPGAARAWVRFVRSDEGREVLSDAGFLAP